MTEPNDSIDFESNETEETQPELTLLDLLKECKTREHGRIAIAEYCEHHGIDTKEFTLTGEELRCFDKLN